MNNLALSIHPIDPSHQNAYHIFPGAHANRSLSVTILNKVPLHAH